MSEYVDTARRTTRTAPMNAVRVEGAIAYLRVENRSRGFIGEAIVDAADLPRLRAFGRRWRAAWHRTTQQFMAVANAKAEGRWTTLLLHRLLLEAPNGIDVDHRNHVMLDCRRDNLRLCTRGQNLENRQGAMEGSASGIRGVYWDAARGRWRAAVQVGGRQIHLGRFETKEQATLAAQAGRARYMTHSAECA